jgi:putative ABC transport system permease protein
MKRFSFFLKISIRNLFNNTRFAWVNIIGLSAGVTISILIMLYVRYETSFESFNANSGNIYRIVTKNLQDGSVGASTPLALSDVLKSDYPEIDKVIGLMRVWDDIKIADKKVGNLKGAIVESDFFDFFHLPLLVGNQKDIFQDPFEAVITKNLSKILFGNTDPLGRTFEYDKNTFTVTGIINDIPPNSILNFDFFLSDKYRYKYVPDIHEKWYDFGLFTFITFKGNILPPKFENNLTNIEKKYFPDFMKNRDKFLVTPFKGSHLNPVLQYDLTPGVEPTYLWILSIIAFGILAIACLNFMNISLASARKRYVEIVIKKLSGASPANLIKDFFTETGILVLISLFISFYGVYLLLPLFRSLIEQNITVNLSDPLIWTGVIGFGIITILLSGLYPSLYLSRPSPMKIFLYNKGSARNKLTFQKSFVVLQFTITIILGITQLFIFKQISFMQNHTTGFDQKNLITVSVNYLDEYSKERLKKTNLLKEILEKNEAHFGYGKASISEFVPGFGFRNNFKIFTSDGKYTDGMELLSCDVDENFMDVFGMKMLIGRFFSNDFSTDRDALIINESAYRKLGWNSVDGKAVGLFSKDNQEQVIGVISDINVRSLQYPVRPMIYQFGPHHMYPGYITLRINPGKKEETINFIEKQWTDLFPGIPFTYESVYEKYKSAYGAEKRLARITGVFSILAMILSMLGIFALSTLEAERRIKEIGIRKINGAKVMEVMAMLNSDFLRWVLIAFIIACPVALYSTHKWLNKFAYRTDLSWWIFGVVGVLIMVIALTTVSWQSRRAATRNPVEALRYE